MKSREAYGDIKKANTLRMRHSISKRGRPEMRITPCRFYVALQIIWRSGAADRRGKALAVPAAHHQNHQIGGGAGLLRRNIM